jgi:hypothetical protein
MRWTNAGHLGLGLFSVLCALSYSARAKTPQISNPHPSVATSPATPGASGADTTKTPPATKRLDDARIDNLDSNFASVTFADCPLAPAKGHSECNGDVLTLAVNANLRPELKTFKKGDHLRIDTDGTNLLSLGIRTLNVRVRTRILVIGIALTGFFLLTTLITRGHPFQLIIGRDGRYSNSQFQMAIWFWVALSTYLAVVYLRLAVAGWGFFGLVNIPQNLLLLSGMSGLTFGGARGITTGKMNAIPAGQPNPKALPAGQRANFWTDLIENDIGQFDIGDFQMLMVTLLAVGMYFALVFHFLGAIEARAAVKLPDIDTTILASFGLGQGAYLAKKAAGNPGTS